MPADSFLVIGNQGRFDKIFGVAMVMGDKMAPAAKNAFKSNIVLAAIKRGKAYSGVKSRGSGPDNGVVELRYTTTGRKVIRPTSPAR